MSGATVSYEAFQETLLTSSGLTPTLVVSARGEELQQLVNFQPIRRNYTNRAGSLLARCQSIIKRVRIVKLAEALSLRADSVRRIERLRSRIVSNARFQEGEDPAEDAAALLAEADEVLDGYETLIRRINRTNAATSIGTDGTLTDALARRDALRARHSVVTAAADAAAGTSQPGYARQLRSELKMLSALPVAELRARADDLARELRELDVRIQRFNWEVDLLD